MRVGVDGRSLDGSGRGVAQYVSGLLAPLADTGVEVRVWASSRLAHAAGAVVRRPRIDRRLGGVDVVWLPAPAPVAVGAPYVLTIHDLSFIERPRDFTAYERLWHRMVRVDALVRRAARVVTDTEDTARRVRERFGAAHVSVVGAGPGDPGPPAGSAEVAAVRTRFGLPERYFLFVGALEPRKALGRLADAHSRSGVDAALVIAGEGRLAPRGPGIHLLGRVSRADKAALYAGALAVVLPSWIEGYGYPPLEGFAHGTPAIVSDLPALRETAGEGARYVPAGDVDGLAAALRELAGDEELRRRLARGGAAALRARSWAASAGALRAALEAAAHEAPR